MMFQVKGALSSEELTEINDALDGQGYVDGRETAANAASLVKRNVQLPVGSELRTRMSQKIEQALRRNQMFLWLAMPKTIGPFHLTRYEETHTYGDHVDSSIMGLQSGAPMRADIWSVKNWMQTVPQGNRRPARPVLPRPEARPLKPAPLLGGCLRGGLFVENRNGAGPAR
jgi:predicted 2-oxoglutarate/Fe(II)-dependent dioxygenase YbiX